MQKHLQMIQSEKLDLAYNGFPDTQDLPGIETIPISKAEIRIVLHPDHQLAKQERIPLSLLAGEKLVMMDAQSKVKRLMDEAFEQQHLSMNVVLNYTQILCMVSLVKSCRYVGIISEAAGHSIPGCEGLVLRSFEEPLVFDLGFFFKKGRYLPKLGWELIRFLQASEKPYLKYWEEKHASGRRQ